MDAPAGRRCTCVERPGRAGAAAGCSSRSSSGCSSGRRHSGTRPRGSTSTRWSRGSAGGWRNDPEPLGPLAGRRRTVAGPRRAEPRLCAVPPTDRPGHAAGAVGAVGPSRGHDARALAGTSSSSTNRYPRPPSWFADTWQCLARRPRRTSRTGPGWPACERRSRDSARGSVRSATRPGGSCSISRGPRSPTPPRRPPVRYLPEYDNVLLGHADRTRVIPEGVPQWTEVGWGSVLRRRVHDGTVEGRPRRQACLDLARRALRRLTSGERRHVVDEGERLLEFLAPDAGKHVVRISKPDASPANRRPGHQPGRS
jgi:hypothetical protein